MEVILFIASNLVQFAGSAHLLNGVTKKKSVYGLSADTQYMLLASTISRCIWSMSTRLIETKLAYLELFCSVIVASLLAYNMFRYRHTTTKQAPLYLQAKCLIPAALLLAFFVHPGNKWFTVQIFVSFSMYVEAVAMIPQLYLMNKMSEIENVTSQYVGTLIISRMIRLAFWIQLYFLGEHFIALLLADLVHTIMSADYLYLWFAKMRNGGKLIYAL